MKKIFLLLLFFSVITHAQWVSVRDGMGLREVRSFATGGNNIIAGTYNYGVFLTSNNGTNWTWTSLNNRSIFSLAVNGNNIFAGTFGYGVYISTNNGTSWTQTSLGNGRDIYSLAVTGNNIFAGSTTSYGLFLSTNNGTSWTQISLNNQIIWSLAVNGNNIFAGTGYGVYLSTNNGTSWAQTSLNNRIIYSLAVNENYIFAGTYLYGVYLSTNNGTSWAQTSLNNLSVYSFAANGNSIFAGSASPNGFYVSNNNGASWTQRTEGLGDLYVRVLCILNNYIFAGTQNSVYRRPLGELVGIHSISNEIPKKFSLSQNYPNPFNPTTKIRFDIKKSGFTKLIVYDILGKEVTVLVNEQLKPGTYETDWDAINYPSGVYYYRIAIHSDKITSGDYSETKKMVLIK